MLSGGHELEAARGINILKELIHVQTGDDEVLLREDGCKGWSQGEGGGSAGPLWSILRPHKVLCTRSSEEAHYSSILYVRTCIGSILT